MGVRFGKEYAEINRQLTDAIEQISDIYDAFEMTEGDWRELGDDERRECLRTLADDVFYGLGADPEMELGSGTVSHDPRNHIIKVSDGGKVITLVPLT